MPYPIEKLEEWTRLYGILEGRNSIRGSGWISPSIESKIQYRNNKPYNWKKRPFQRICDDLLGILLMIILLGVKDTNTIQKIVIIMQHTFPPLTLDIYFHQRDHTNCCYKYVREMVEAGQNWKKKKVDLERFSNTQ